MIDVLGRISLGVDAVIGFAALVWGATWLLGVTLNAVVEAFIGVKYIMQYVYDAKGREQAKERVDSTVVVGTPENPYPEVTP